MRFLRLLPLAAAAAFAVYLAGAGAAAAAVTHTVRRGETLTSIAAIDALSVSSLAAANGLSPFAELLAGGQLIIPPQGEAGPAPVLARVQAAPAAVAAPVSGGYVVPRGATLTAIAARFGTSVSALATANGMTPDGILFAGLRLSLPGEAAPSAPAAPAAPVAEPTAQFVAPSQVGEIAAQDNVAPSLAEAIADQESGFNNNEVSSTGAIGVMQIEPSTWRDLTGPGGLHLSTSSATDNIRGGVALLHGLLVDTGGNETETIAGYYQGLASVRARGMYADTRQYVRDVLALQSRFGG